MNGLVTYSPKVFIPLTKLCRDVCHYCTFAQPPRRGERAYMSADEVLAVAREGAEAGCHEALFTLGDKPELRYRAAREELAALGCATTIEYLERMAGLVLSETGLLPHLNPGVMTREDLLLLRPVSASMGLMLESTSLRLAEKGMPHHGSPDKLPAARLETIRLAGELAVPFTTGILIGIGETRDERLDALEAIAALHERHGHIQEVIVQNFRAKPGTKMAAHAEPSLEELIWTARAAREILPADVHLQVPPNLSYDEFPQLLESGIDDWGGVSPVTIDHVNPEAPWPEIQRLREATEAHGFELAARLPIYPEFVADLERWADRRIAPEIRRHADASGLAREERWAAGAPGNMPALRTGAGRRLSGQVAGALAQVEAGVELDEDAVTALFEARGADLGAVLAAADDLRREVCGDEVSYVVTRNVNYTNVCYFRCGFCAFSKGKLAANLRGKPYVVPLAEIVRRAEEAWERGAVEICLQGGIHPAFTGETYLEICAAVKEALPDLHVHAFSALEVWQGAATLDLPLDGLPRPTPRRRPRLAPRHGGRDPRRRGAAHALPGQGLDRTVARGARRRPSGRAALDDDSHVRLGRGPAQLGAAPPRPARPAAAQRRLHGVRAAPVRAHGGPDLPEGRRPPGADVPRGAAHARRRPASAAPLDHERAGLMGEARDRRGAGRAPCRGERPGRDADERVHLPRRRRRARPGDAARGHGGGDPRDRPHAAPADDPLRHAGPGAHPPLLRRAGARPSR